MSDWQQEALGVLVKRAEASGWHPNDETRAYWALVLAALFDPRRMVVVSPIGPGSADQLRAMADQLEQPLAPLAHSPLADRKSVRELAVGQRFRHLNADWTVIRNDSELHASHSGGRTIAWFDPVTAEKAGEWSWYTMVRVLP